MDPNLGWTYLRARWMDPETGRFASRDPFGGRTSDPQSLHRYTYAHDNPIDRSDPSGEKTLIEGLITVGKIALATVAFLAWIEAALTYVRAPEEGGGWSNLTLMQKFTLLTGPLFAAAMLAPVAWMALPGATAAAAAAGGGTAFRVVKSGPWILEKVPQASRIVRWNHANDHQRFRHMFNASGGGNHSLLFDAPRNFSLSGMKALKDGIMRHVLDPATVQIRGGFANSIGAAGTHYYNPVTRLWVVLDESGAFFVGWQLRAEQVVSLLGRGWAIL